MTQFQVAKRTTLTENIYEQIVVAIRDGQLKAGAKLPSERTLMREFGASRASIREALRALAQAKVIEIRQGSGAYVNGVSADSLMDYSVLSLLIEREAIYELQAAREVVEVGAAKMAALHAAPSDLDALEQCVREMEHAAEAGDSARFSRADLAYHRAIASATHNPVIVHILHTFHSLLVRALEHANSQSTSLAASAQRHRAIYVAIGRHDSALAMRLMEEKLSISSHFIAESFGHADGALTEHAEHDATSEKER